MRSVNGERHPELNFPLCVYCGDPACSKDHVPPISRVDDYLSLGLRREVFIKVPSCLSCNKMLGDSLQDNFLDRVEVLKGKMFVKWCKMIGWVEWDDDELEELGVNLRSHVVVSLDKQYHVIKRYEYYSGVDIILDMID
jgi:hypothetical protein